MRLFSRYWLAAVCVLLLTACAPPVARWRNDAVRMVDRVRSEDAKRYFPEAFADLDFALRQGDLLFADKEVEKADDFYLLTIAKGELLEKAVAAERARREAARKAEEARRQEEEKLREEEAARQRLLAEEQAEARRHADADAAERRKAERARIARERALVSSHTVKRGETLPQIAAQPEVYGDPNLWPLLYRANRDQIRDPQVVWPGQTLRIPRNLSREEISEARRYSQEKPLH